VYLIQFVQYSVYKLNKGQQVSDQDLKENPMLYAKFPEDQMKKSPGRDAMAVMKKLPKVLTENKQ